VLFPTHALGMNPHQSGSEPFVLSRVRMPVLPPPPPPVETAPLAPVQTENVLSPPTETPGTPTIPASASVSIALPSPAPAATDIFSSFMNWLTEETLYPGFPNGFLLAGGAVGAALLFRGKRGRR
jgi:hypothetical protein